MKIILIMEQEYAKIEMLKNRNRKFRLKNVLARNRNRNFARPWDESEFFIEVYPSKNLLTGNVCGVVHLFQNGLQCGAQEFFDLIVRCAILPHRQYPWRQNASFPPRGIVV